MFTSQISQGSRALMRVGRFGIAMLGAESTGPVRRKRGPSVLAQQNHGPTREFFAASVISFDRTGVGGESSTVT